MVAKAMRPATKKLRPDVIEGAGNMTKHTVMSLRKEFPRHIYRWNQSNQPRELCAEAKTEEGCWCSRIELVGGDPCNIWLKEVSAKSGKGKDGKGDAEFDTTQVAH